MTKQIKIPVSSLTLSRFEYLLDYNQCDRERQFEILVDQAYRQSIVNQKVMESKGYALKSKIHHRDA